MNGREGLRGQDFGAKGQEAAQAEAEAWADLLRVCEVDPESLLSGKMSAEELGRLVERRADRILMEDAKAGARILLAMRGTHDGAMREIDN